MITYVEGDATQPVLAGRPGIIVHCCNDLGRWGSGFVLALDARWPEPRKSYLEKTVYQLGSVDFIRVVRPANLYVANLIGQHGTRGPFNEHPVKYDAIFEGLKVVASVARISDSGLHFPRMGAGLAGGHWPVIEGLINETMADLDVTVYGLPARGPSQPASV